MSKMSSGSMSKHIVIVAISFVVTFSFSLKEVHFPYLLTGDWWVISPCLCLHPWVFHCFISPLSIWGGAWQWLCWVPSIQPGSTHHNVVLESMSVKKEKLWGFFSVRSGQGQKETVLPREGVSYSLRKLSMWFCAGLYNLVCLFSQATIWSLSNLLFLHKGEDSKHLWNGYKPSIVSVEQIRHASVMTTPRKSATEGFKPFKPFTPGVHSHVTAVKQLPLLPSHTFVIHKHGQHPEGHWAAKSLRKRKSWKGSRENSK